MKRWGRAQVTDAELHGAKEWRLQMEKHKTDVAQPGNIQENSVG